MLAENFNHRGAFRLLRRQRVPDREAEVGLVVRSGASGQEKFDESRVAGPGGYVQNIVSNFGLRVGIRPELQEDLGDLIIAEDGNVDECHVSKIIRGVDGGTLLGKETHTVYVIFHCEKVEDGLTVNPTSVQRVRMSLEHLSSPALVTYRCINELSDQVFVHSAFSRIRSRFARRRCD